MLVSIESPCTTSY